MLAVSIAELRYANACGLNDRIFAFAAHFGYTPVDDEPVPLAKWAEVTPNVADLLWALRCCWGRGGRAVGVEVACRAADRAMIYIRTDDAFVPRAAVDAARGCVSGTVTVEACRDAADAAARAAAYAAYAAYAASAAYAAADAARAAAYAAYAAYAASAAYAAAAADAADAAYAAYAAADAAAERAAQRADLLSLLAEVKP